MRIHKEHQTYLAELAAKGISREVSTVGVSYLRERVWRAHQELDEARRVAIVANDINYAVFVGGSARTKEGSADWRLAYDLGLKLGQLRCDVITGGGPGSMEAVNKGHMQAFSAGVNGIRSHGVGIEVPHETKLNDYLHFGTTYENFKNRLIAFDDLANSHIFLPGGWGTWLEMFSVLQEVQIGNIPNPCIIATNFWKEPFDRLNQVLLDNRRGSNQTEFISENDKERVFFTDDTNEIMMLLSEHRARWEKRTEPIKFVKQGKLPGF